MKDDLTEVTGECVLQVALNDFIDAVKSLKVGRKLGKRNLNNEEAVFGFSDQELVVEAVGAQRRMRANGTWQGRVHLAFLYVDALRRAPPTQDPLQIRFANGKLRIGTTVLPASWTPS
ncbi:MAG: hypothetical protein U1F76_21435 [Candidatus Competibacteraceae bacterium]